MNGLAGFGRATACAIIVASVVAFNSANAQTKIKIGATQTAAGGTLYLAIDRGYFAEEGITASVVFLDPLAIYSGVVAGDLDFGQTGSSAAFYNLASKGALRIIAAKQVTPLDSRFTLSSFRTEPTTAA